MTKRSSKRLSKTSIHWPTIVLIVSLVLLLIPTVALGMVLLDAFEGTGQIQHGNRFNNERLYEITSEEVKAIDTQVKGLSGIEKSEVNLKSGTLRVNTLVSESLSKEQVETLTNDILSTVFGILDKDKYFTMIDASKQYDLEVHAYNSNNPSDSGFIYYIANKNAVMEDVSIQLVSDPKNEEFVKELYDKLYNPEEEDDEETSD